MGKPSFMQSHACNPSSYNHPRSYDLRYEPCGDYHLRTLGVQEVYLWNMFGAGVGIVGPPPQAPN